MIAFRIVTWGVLVFSGVQKERAAGWFPVESCFGLVVLGVGWGRVDGIVVPISFFSEVVCG